MREEMWMGGEWVWHDHVDKLYDGCRDVGCTARGWRAASPLNFDALGYWIYNPRRVFAERLEALADERHGL